MSFKKTIRGLFLLITSLSIFSFVIGDAPLKELLDKFQKYTTLNVQEKVYLQTDKPFYAIGDSIWFKAYVLDAKTLGPTPNSNILYVDLIDAKDAIKRTLRLPLVAGLGWGHFELKDSLVEGNYRLRAYTAWMRNYDQSFFFDKTLKVGNAWTNQVLTKADYIFSKEESKEKVSSKINFSNLEGLAYANREVSYSVVINGKSLSKGKGTTDNEGNFTLDFVNNKSLEGNGYINASIELTKGTVVEKAIPIKSTSNAVDVQFFPEGGDLIQEVRSKVAFKALGADGLGKPISGYVQDNDGTKIALIKTTHLGMGYFTMMPMTGKTYEAVVQFEDGSERSIDLPTPKNEGITLAADALSKDSLLLKIATNQAFLEKNSNQEFTVVAQNNGNIIYTAKSKLNSLAFLAKIDKSRFMSGINQLTLFNEKMQPLSERLIFVAPKDTIAVSISTDRANYTERSKTVLNIHALLPNGKPVSGAFSLSLVDADKVPVDGDSEESIYSNILLTSDLKGYIENPNYYFYNVNEQKSADVDVLMLTQGWRRFSWGDLSVNVKDLAFKPERTLNISGRVTQGRDKHKPVVNGTVTVFSSAGSAFLIQTKTNKLGEFKIDSLYFPDSTRFVVQARTDKDKKGVDIELYNTSFPAVTENPYKADLTVNINESMIAYLKNSKNQYEEWLKNGMINRSIMLGEVVVTAKKPKLETSSNLNGPGYADNVFTETDLNEVSSIEILLLSRVAGLTIENGIAYLRGKEAQIVLDGMFVEPDFLSAIPITDVESVEILKSVNYLAMYGTRGMNGVIVITTKIGKPGYVSKAYVPGIITYQPIGIFQRKDFYVPNYANPDANTATRDLRTTIYWNPNIITDSLGNAKVSFYNGDNPGKYRVILEGTDLNGHLARKVINYKVTAKN